MKRFLALSVLLLLLGCVAQPSQKMEEPTQEVALPTGLGPLIPENAFLLDNVSSSTPIQVGMMGEITYDLGKENSKSFTYAVSSSYEELLEGYKRNFDGWKLTSIKVRDKDSRPLAVALTLGLSALRDYSSVSFIYGKEGCDYQFCPRMGVTVVSGDPPHVTVSCVAYDLNEKEFAAFVDEENRAKQESLELGNQDVGSLIDPQTVIAANEGACS